MRIGVDDDRNVDRIGNRAEIGLDAGIGQREIRFEDRKDAVGAEFLIGLGLRHRIRRRCRDDAGDHGHAALRRCDRGLDHRGALRGIEIGEFAGEYFTSALRKRFVWIDWRYFPEAFAKNRTDSKAKPVRGIFDIVVNPSVRVGLAEITWSFFSCARDTSKKTFLANPRLPARAPAESRTRGAEVEWDEALGTPSALVMELAAV